MSARRSTAVIVVPLFEDRYENLDLGLVRVRRADIMDDGKVRFWDWHTLAGRDGEPATRYDREVFWALEDLEQVVERARLACRS